MDGEVGREGEGKGVRDVGGRVRVRREEGDASAEYV